MTDKIDYRYNAEERVKLAITQGTTEEGFLVAQIAMAEATLALVEQQRVANLIAYASHRLDHRSAVGPLDGNPYPNVLSSALGRADAEIRNALGLFKYVEDPTA